MLWAAVLFWIVAFIGLTLCDCLRAFTRSRLLTECKRRGHEERFRDILERDEHALLIAHLLALVSLVAAVVCSILACDGLHQPDGPSVAYVVELVAVAVLIVLGLAVLPWAISQIAAEQIVDRTWPFLSLLIFVGRPLLGMAEFTRTICFRLADRDEQNGETDHISEEIDAVVDEGERDGSIEEGVSQMIQRVVDLQNVDVRDVMTPRTEIVTLTVDTPLDDARDCFVTAGHSRIPVIGESPDDLLGVVYAKDLLHTNSDIPSLSSLLREPLLVPESTAVDQLLERMRQRRMHIAIVLDEYGGVVGLVTLEDILEEIVGEISDEFDPEGEEEEVVRIDERTIEVDARMHLDDLNDQFDYQLPEDADFETVGGYVFSALGHVPTVGESLVQDGLEMTVLEADRRKIVRLQIRELSAEKVSP